MRRKFLDCIWPCHAMQFNYLSRYKRSQHSQKDQHTDTKDLNTCRKMSTYVYVFAILCAGQCYNENPLSTKEISYNFTFFSCYWKITLKFELGTSISVASLTWCAPKFRANLMNTPIWMDCKILSSTCCTMSIFQGRARRWSSNTATP